MPWSPLAGGRCAHSWGTKTARNAIDEVACRFFLGKNVFANHGLTVMSVGTLTIEDGVMLGPEVGLFTVNHEPKNIRVIFTKAA